MRLVFKIERVAENPEEERILRKRKSSEEQLIKEEVRLCLSVWYRYSIFS